MEKVNKGYILRRGGFGAYKSYIKSKFGAKSPQAVYMNNLKFKKQKIS